MDKMMGEDPLGIKHYARGPFIILMQAAGANVAGQIASVVAGGLLLAVLG